MLSQKSDIDWIFALNKSLLKVEIPAYIQFNRVKNLSSKIISALFIKKSRTKKLFDNHSNILIKTASIEDMGIMRIETLECWQKWKIYGMSFVKYLEKRKMELLFQKIKLSIEKQLKTITC